LTVVERQSTNANDIKRCSNALKDAMYDSLLTSNRSTVAADARATCGRQAVSRRTRVAGGLLVAQLLPLLAPLVVDGCLAVLAPPAEVRHALTAGWSVDATGTSLITVGVAVAAWAVAAWLTLCAVTAAAARLPGTCGRAAHAAAERITPGVMRRLIGGGAAAGLALAPALLPVVAQAANAPAAHCRAVSSASALPSLDRPLPPCAPAQPNAARPPGVSHPPPTQPAAPPTAPTASHVVVAGDSLWSLAQAQLTRPGTRPAVAQVAARWPAWWAANRAEIGPDPGLLRVGEVLHIPAAT
jgi:hypothetical protein